MIFIELFITFFVIGMFTIGGGYAMLSLIQDQVVNVHGWITEGQFTDIVAISQMTPGPIGINSATYIGYKSCGVLGSFFATLGVVLPSFIIIFSISLFYDAFIRIKWVEYAFKGINACVAFLILSAGLKMLKKLKKTMLNIVLFLLTICGIITFSMFLPQISFSSIFYILIGGVVGLVVYLISYLKKKTPKDQKGKGED